MQGLAERQWPGDGLRTAAAAVLGLRGLSLCMSAVGGRKVGLR